MTQEERKEMLEAIDLAMHEIIKEFGRASNKYPSFNSAHEGFAVILEEVDELKAEVWKNRAARTKEAMRREACQVAAMAFRFIVDCCGKDRRDDK